MRPEDRLRTHPKERLAAPVQRIDLTEAVQQLRAEAHAAVAGHRQVALVRHGPVSLILFAFEPDGFLNEHRTDGEVTIHVLSGSLELTVENEVLRVGPKELISLAPGQSHSVRATTASEMLLTICRVPVDR